MWVKFLTQGNNRLEPTTSTLRVRLATHCVTPPLKELRANLTLGFISNPYLKIRLITYLLTLLNMKHTIVFDQF